MQKEKAIFGYPREGYERSFNNAIRNFNETGSLVEFSDLVNNDCENPTFTHTRGNSKLPNIYVPILPFDEDWILRFGEIMTTHSINSRALNNLREVPEKFLDQVRNFKELFAEKEIDIEGMIRKELGLSSV